MSKLTPAPQRETVDLCQLHTVEWRVADSKPRAALSFSVAVPAPLRARFERANEPLTQQQRFHAPQKAVAASGGRSVDSGRPTVVAFAKKKS